MASSPAGYDEPPKEDNSKKILFRFCADCSNLLFPREDKVNNRLLFACRTCTFTEEAPTPCVMRHEIASSVGDTAGITQDVGQDPTVGLTRSFSSATLYDNNDPDFGIDIPPVCTMCGQEIICIVCEEEPAPGIALETLDQDSEPEAQTQTQTEGTPSGNGNTH